MEEEAAKAKMEEEEEADAELLEVAAILCDLSRLMKSRDRRKRRRERARDAFAAHPPVIPSWGRRRPRSQPEDNPSSPAPVPAPASAPAAPAAADRDAAASPDTPLAYPESGGDDAPPKDRASAAAARPRDQWSEEEKHGEAAASLSQPPENARSLLQVEQGPVPALVVLDLNEPARAAADDGELQLQLLQARAAAAAEWYRQAQMRAARQKAAVSAGARRRRLEILRAKAACPLASSRMRRAG